MEIPIYPIDCVFQLIKKRMSWSLSFACNRFYLYIYKNPPSRRANKRIVNLCFKIQNTNKKTCIKMLKQSK